MKMRREHRGRGQCRKTLNILQREVAGGQRVQLWRGPICSVLARLAVFEARLLRRAPLPSPLLPIPIPRCCRDRAVSTNRMKATEKAQRRHLVTKTPGSSASFSTFLLHVLFLSSYGDHAPYGAPRSSEILFGNCPISFTVVVSRRSPKFTNNATRWDSVLDTQVIHTITTPQVRLTRTSRCCESLLTFHF